MGVIYKKLASKKFIIFLFLVFIFFAASLAFHYNNQTLIQAPANTSKSPVKPKIILPPKHSNQPKVSYISAGNIPVSGLRVGATFYGALDSPVNGQYIVSNYIQGGQKNGGDYNGYDDNGEGACDGKYQNLANQSTWAEDEMGKALGNLPCGTKLEITYDGHSVVAEKADISDGGCNQGQTSCSDSGVRRGIDLWWQTAKALCLADQPATVTIHAVPASTPTTSIMPYSADNPSSYSICK